MTAAASLTADGFASLVSAAPTAPPASVAFARSKGMTPLTSAQKLSMTTKAAKDFEAFFITSMMESMYAGMKPDKMFGGGSGEEMYRSLLNQEYGKAIAERDVLGIADEVRAEMLRSQEAH